MYRRRSYQHSEFLRIGEQVESNEQVDELSDHRHEEAQVNLIREKNDRIGAEGGNLILDTVKK